MGNKGGWSEEKTDWLGDKYTQNYDEYGNKTSWSEEKTDIFGDKYTQHYGSQGYDKSGWSEGKTDIFGDKYTQHYGSQGYDKSGWSEGKTDIFGDKYTQHYGSQGYDKSGWSEGKTGIFGDKYTQHYDYRAGDTYPRYGDSESYQPSIGASYGSSSGASYDYYGSSGSGNSSSLGAAIVGGVIICVLILIGFSLVRPVAESSRPNPQVPQVTGIVGNPTSYPSSPSSNVTVRYVGRIGASDINMILQIDRIRLTGEYTYTQLGVPIQIEGTVGSDKNITINRYENGIKIGEFNGSFGPDNGELSGTYISHKDKKGKPFALYRSASAELQLAYTFDNIAEKTDEITEKPFPEGTIAEFRSIRIDPHKGNEVTPPRFLAKSQVSEQGKVTFNSVPCNVPFKIILKKFEIPDATQSVLNHKRPAEYPNATVPLKCGDNVFAGKYIIQLEPKLETVQSLDIIEPSSTGVNTRPRRVSGETSNQVTDPPSAPNDPELPSTRKVRLRPPEELPSPTSTQMTVRVSGGVLQGGAIKKVQPLAYPPLAKNMRVEGAVQIQIVISEEGKVIDASVVSGHPLLRDAALQAAKQWIFKPTKLSGVPVKVTGILTFNFTL